VPSGTAEVRAQVSPDRWYVLAVLTGVYALNIADRFSVSTLLEPIRQELKLSDGGIGALTGPVLGFFYVTVGLPIAALADRANRRNILVCALAAWSSMTVAFGLARNVPALVLARVGVGIGEAGGTPPSTSILADKFLPAQRPMALTVYALGACLGAWLGSWLAGAAAERAGWRAAFLVLGAPGLALALLVWVTVREPTRGALDVHARAEPTSFSDTLRYLRQQRSALHILIGAAVATLWSWGLICGRRRSWSAVITSASGKPGRCWARCTWWQAPRARSWPSGWSGAPPRPIRATWCACWPWWSRCAPCPRSSPMLWVQGALRPWRCGSLCRGCISISGRSWDFCRMSFPRTCAPRYARCFCSSQTSAIS